MRSPPVKLLARVRTAIRVRHYSRRTEQIYVGWIRRFIRFHGLRHPRELGGDEVTAFLNWLAEERRVSRPTQSQALSAILFLYRNVLEVELPWMQSLVRAPLRQRLPVVLSRDEVRTVLRRLDGPVPLVVALRDGLACSKPAPTPHQPGPTALVHPTSTIISGLVCTLLFLAPPLLAASCLGRTAPPLSVSVSQVLRPSGCPCFLAIVMPITSCPRMA